MSKEMLHRIKTAGEYHRKAIHALFPEKVSGHLDVIEEELKMMLWEIAADAVKDYRECKKRDDREEDPDRKKTTDVKKVDIA